jgi:hypothetical protein
MDKRPLLQSVKNSERPEWNTWRGMIARCYNRNASKYKNYGALGVKVHSKWRRFANFFRDVGPKPTPRHSLDRFPDPTGNYEPGNVRWATQKEQCRNWRKQKRYTAYGITLCLTDWSIRSGINLQTLSWRINTKKQPIKKALRPVS